MRAIIIGSGIGGLTAAIALRRIGIEITVYERAPEPREVGAGIGLWANAVGALRHINLSEAVLSRAERMQTAEFRLADGRALVSTPAAEFERIGGAPMALIHRAELLEELLRPLPAGTVRFGHTCTGFHPPAPGEPGTVRADFTAPDGSAHGDQTDLLIGADGLHSIIRTGLFGQHPPHYVGYTCWRGVLPFPIGPLSPTAVPAGYVGEVWGRGARFGITRIGGGRVYWWATLNAPQSPTAQGTLDAAAKDTLLRSHARFFEPIPSLLRATDATQIHRNDLFDRPPLPHWSRGRVLLIGDAAHPTTPNLGMGGCMAIEDGVLLAEALRGAAVDDVEARFAAFVRRRADKTAQTVRESRQLGAIGQWKNPVMCFGRNLVMSLVAKPMFRRASRKIGRFDP